MSTLRLYHPISFLKDIPYDRPIAARVLQKPIVIWRDPQCLEKFHCMEDRCPHRSAQLSKGSLTEHGLRCNYHGWEFDGNGSCLHVPQCHPKQRIPKSCQVPSYPTLLHQQILYAGFPAMASQPVSHGIFPGPLLRSDDAFITDYFLEAPYAFWLQIENLLDPAHIHFVHNGFQGDIAKAKYIRLTQLQVDEWQLQGTFTHDDPLIPDIRITFYAPHTVDVHILDRYGHTTRRNIIYTTPIDANTCRVFFRDVAYKKYMVPPHGGFSRLLLGTPMAQQTYYTVNQSVVEQIMQQDIDILQSQQLGMGGNLDFSLETYLASREILLTESDRLIVAFRQWCKKKKDWLLAAGYQ